MKHVYYVLFIVLISLLSISWIFAPHTNSVADPLAALTNKAQSEHKNIAVYFSGSDWCSVCYQFKKGFLATPKVDSILTNHYVYYNADFPQRKKLVDSVLLMNEGLAEKLNADGVFPKLVVADENMKVKAIIVQGIEYNAAMNLLVVNQKK
jgi:thioredoxin-related protein